MMRGLLVSLVVLMLTSCCIAHGVTGKFRNLTGRKLRLFWVNFQNEPQMNGYINAGAEYSFATYVTHKFFWSELSGNPEPIKTPGADPKSASFAIETGKVVYVITDNTTPSAQLKEYEEHLAFMNEYKSKTGRQWIAGIPRPPPIHKYRPAPFIGHEEKIAIDSPAFQWTCGEDTPACRSDLSSLTMETMSLEPRVFRVKNFLSEFECDQIIDHFKDKMTRSFVGDGENAKDDGVRTSTSARMSRHSLPLSDAVYRRLASVIDLDEEMLNSGGIAEAMNIVHYKTTQEYTPHFDTGGSSAQRARFLSSLMYFNTPEGGGATGFPAMVNDDGTIGGQVSAEKGTLVFFYDILEDGNYDERSIHSGLPVKKGEKWIAASWLWDPHYSSTNDKWIAEHRTSNHPSLFDKQGIPISPLPAWSEEKGWEFDLDQRKQEL